MNAVLYSWHQLNCADPVLHGHPKVEYLACATCGRIVQQPQKSEPINAKRVEVKP